jgi:hypothetical protein
MILSRVVLACCKACLQGSEDDLAAEQEKFRVGAGSPSKASSTGGFPTASSLGSAPPTASLQQLKTLKVIKLIPPTLYTEIQEREDYKDIRKSLTDALCPVKDLIKVIKERANAMKTRKSALKDEKGKKFGDLSAPAVLHNFLHMCL